MAGTLAMIVVPVLFDTTAVVLVNQPMLAVFASASVAGAIEFCWWRERSRTRTERWSVKAERIESLKSTTPEQPSRDFH
jgi:hypothetical protein